MKLCEYGCGQEAKYQFKNGKWCCSRSFNLCPVQRKKKSKSNKGKNTGPLSEEHKKNISEAKKDKPLSEEHKKNIRKALRGKKLKPLSKETKKKLKIFNKKPIEYWKEKYPFFSKIEEMRYDPNKSLEEKEIQVHCKNHECPNSKEKDGWFTPTYIQLYERIRALESQNGSDCSYFYCSQRCKDTCILYGQGDPYKDINLPYTPGEYQTCRAVVLEREHGLCEYCGEPATDMHHIYPVKKEPFFALDPDYCVACCEKHHYEYGHKDECSTGNLAKIVCSVESQKFLEQKIN